MSQPNKYEEIASFSESIDGGSTVACTISKRDFGGVRRFSFRFTREFKDKDGQPQKAHWWDLRHMAALRRALERVESAVKDVEK